jgi:hypothetical protein
MNGATHQTYIGTPPGSTTIPLPSGWINTVGTLLRRAHGSKAACSRRDRRTPALLLHLVLPKRHFNLGSKVDAVERLDNVAAGFRDFGPIQNLAIGKRGNKYDRHVKSPANLIRGFDAILGTAQPDVHQYQ